MNKARPIIIFSLTTILIFTIAFLVRVISLGILPVFADEAIYIRWSQIMAAEPTLRFLPLSDGKQPLFMWILMFLVRKLPDPLIAGRLISVFTGLGTIAGIMLLSYTLFRSLKAALFSACLWAISPFSVFFDRMALVDSMLAFFTVWTYLFSVLLVKTKRIDVAFCAGFALGGAALTKSPALFVALLMPLSILSIKLPKRKNLFKYLFTIAGLFLISYAIALVMYNIQRLGPNFHLLSARTKDYIFPISHLWENPKDPFIFHFRRVLEWIWAMGPAALYFIGFLAVIFTSKFWREKLLLISWFLLPILVQTEFAKVFTARYILYTLPAFYILGGLAFMTKDKLKIKLAYVVFAVFVLQSFLFNRFLLTNPEAAPLPRGERSGYLEEWTSGTGIKEASQYIKEEHQKEPNKQIVVGTEGFFGTLPDGLQMYLDGVPNVVVIGIGLHIGEVHESLRESVEAGNKTYLVANSSRLNMEKSFKARGMTVIKEFKKAKRPDFIKEYVQYGEQDTFYLFKIENKSP